MVEGQGTTELFQFTPRHILHNRGEKDRRDLSQNQTTYFQLDKFDFLKIGMTQTF